MLIPPSLSRPEGNATGRAAGLHELYGETMGTTWSVKLVAPEATSPAALKPLIQRELDRVVAQMSPWLPDSEISRFNAAFAGTWHSLSDAFFFVLEQALDVAAKSGGACDPTVGALVDLWGFGPRPAGTPYRSTPPTSEEIGAARARCGWRQLDVDKVRRTVRQPGGLTLDLSAIAKGYGVDRVARSLEQAGVPAFLVEVGGELSGHGVKPDGLPWWVELENPHAAAHEAKRTILALHGVSVATSGDYRRYFESDGIRYAHSIDPRTGWPVSNGLSSVTVVHASCMQADAMSTTLTVLGPDDGMVHARRHGIAALFVIRAGSSFEERMSPAMAAMLD